MKFLPRTIFCIFCIICVFCLACDGEGGASDTGVTSDSARDTGVTVDTGAPVDTGPGEDAGDTLVETRSLTAGPFNVATGIERTQCMSFDLGNESAAMVRAIRTHLTFGSHHMIVYRLDEAPDPTPRDCGAFSHGVAASLFIAQQPEASLVYPDGAGLPIDAHQTIGIEMHYINYMPGGPVDISGTVDLDLIAPDPEFGVVELMFSGDLEIDIPARGTATETTIHFVPPTAENFGLTSHTHQWGVRATIHRGRSTAMPGELLHTSTTWSEPPLDIYDPPITFASGEGLVLTCDFENTSDRRVRFGTDFADEMCFLWAYLIR